MAKLRVELLLAFLLAAGQLPAAGLGVGGGNATLHWDAAQLDYQRGQVVLRDVQITQGATSIQADLAEASGLEFDDSNWKFSGNVRVRMPQGNLAADTATVKFVDSRVSAATVHGSPAVFAGEAGEVGEGRQAARGHAQDIDYDVASDEVRLSGEAWLSDGRNEINGARIVYNVAAQRVQAEGQAGSGGRVSGTIRPRTAPTSTPAPAPAPAPSSPTPTPPGTPP
jgi:lipopolysaccharide export system protein LptA